MEASYPFTLNTGGAAAGPTCGGAWVDLGEARLSGEKYWLGADEGIAFTPTGENRAFTEYADTVPRAMTDHSRTMDAGMFEIVGKNVYQIFGFALVGDDRRRR